MPSCSMTTFNEQLSEHRLAKHLAADKVWKDRRGEFPHIIGEQLSSHWLMNTMIVHNSLKNMDAVTGPLPKWLCGRSLGEVPASFKSTWTPTEDIHGSELCPRCRSIMGRIRALFELRELRQPVHEDLTLTVREEICKDMLKDKRVSMRAKT